MIITFSPEPSDERGSKYILPDKIRITGRWIFADLDNAADIVLYDAVEFEDD